MAFLYTLDGFLAHPKGFSRSPSMVRPPNTLCLSRAREKFQTSAICHTCFINRLDITVLSIRFLWQMFRVFLYVDEIRGNFASRQAQNRAKTEPFTTDILCLWQMLTGHHRPQQWLSLLDCNSHLWGVRIAIVTLVPSQLKQSFHAYFNNCFTAVEQLFHCG